MSDVVDRLRETRVLGLQMQVCLDAANEIERLRQFERWHDRRMMNPGDFAVKWGDVE